MQIERRLAQTGSSSVFVARLNHSTCVVKRVPHFERGLSVSAVRELFFLRQFAQHPNIARLIGAKNDTDYLYILLEFLPTSLRTVITPYMKRDARENIMYQLARGLGTLHKMRVMHRDLKPENLLLTYEGVLKIADFGIARILHPDRRHTLQMVTLWYRSREVLRDEPYDLSVDIWSCACIWDEMTHGKVTFPGENVLDMLRRIKERQEAMSTGEKARSKRETDCRLFFSKMLNETPAARPTADECIAFFARAAALSSPLSDFVTIDSAKA